MPSAFDMRVGGGTAADSCAGGGTCLPTSGGMGGGGASAPSPRVSWSKQRCSKGASMGADSTGDGFATEVTHR